MGDFSSTTRDEISANISHVVAAHWKFMLFGGMVLAILGLLAAAMPLISSFAVEVLIGWLFFVGGIFRTVMLLSERRIPSFWWLLFAAFLTSAFGLLLIAAPFQGIITLTVVLIIIFSIEGVTAIIAAFSFRPHFMNWGWLLFSGLVDLVLAAMIWTGLPGTATWALGLLAGVCLFTLGLSLILLALAAK